MKFNIPRHASGLDSLREVHQKQTASSGIAPASRLDGTRGPGSDMMRPKVPVWFSTRQQHPTGGPAPSTLVEVDASDFWFI